MFKGLNENELYSKVGDTCCQQENVTSNISIFRFCNGGRMSRCHFRDLSVEIIQVLASKSLPDTHY